MPTVLDIGCGPKAVVLPPYYADWTHVRLDIDPAYEPDIMLDARRLTTLPAGSYDAAHCSHNLEHFFRHEGILVATGMRHVIKPDGFAELRVPNLGAVFQAISEQKFGLDNVLYQSDVGPITVHDVIYGYQPEIRLSGQEFYAHRTGFTQKSLHNFLGPAGFGQILIGSCGLELIAYCFAGKATAAQAKMLAIPENVLGL